MKRSLVVELVDFLHVPEDDELFVDDARGDLLHPTGHFPQVGLPKKEAKGFKKKINSNFQEAATPIAYKQGPGA